ncbi:hypothetical protein [Nocardiopsis synnemataformans]|uniref:hypothetical protein n=1 Tax=Nocardiopsis synnemataformans TaxID=61305 RepID=UPI003EBA7DE0
MAIIWQNTFDGLPGIGINVSNSSGYGDPISAVSGSVDYSLTWTAHGRASARLGTADGAGADNGEGGLTITVPPTSPWSLRLYLYRSTETIGYCYGYLGGTYLWQFDPEYAIYEIGGQDVTEHSANLSDRPIRIEAAATSDGTSFSMRVWWTDPHSTGAPDWSSAVIPDAVPLDTLDLLAGGFGYPPAYVDEVVIAEGEWIGPIPQPPSATGAAEGRLIIRGIADGWASGYAPAVGRLAIRGSADGWPAQQGPGDGRLAIRGSADGMAGPTVATAPPVEDMWLGPLGLLHRMDERGAWERIPALGVSTHVSLHGQVTASRPRWAPRSTSLTWDRLTPADADALTELALVGARADSTIAVIDPDATNLLTAEQSRGRPLAGAAPAATEDLYRVDGAGAIVVGLVAGVRHACTQDVQAGDDLTWLHPYYGTRGWPIMPGWPVYLRADTTGGRLWLTFRDWTGAVISSAAGLPGSGMCEADAPAGAVTVTPHLVFTSPLSGLHLIGEASLSYAPPEEGARPLGNGAPVYAAIGLADTPALPHRTLSLQLQEVRALAIR